MQFFWITLETRYEKSQTLLRVIESLSIWTEEKDLYIVSLEILNDTDFNHFFNTLMNQVKNSATNSKNSIEPFTSQII